MTMTARKKKITVIVLSAVLVLALSAGLAAGIFYGINHDRYSGYVYEAGSGDPLAGVSVTNGRDVVKTDENGKFVLDGWLKQRFITVSIPSGYWTEDYYIETAKDIESYDFYLDKKEEDESKHSFLQVTDTEINGESKVDFLDYVKESAQNEDASFIIHTGDICYEEGLKRHIEVMNTENMGVPVRYVIGNHDFVKWGKYSEDLFESTYGPVNYSFDIGNIHYVATSLAYGDNRARYSRSDVWRWLANDLAQVDESKKVIIFNHDYCPDENGFTVKYGTKTLDLREEGLIGWVFGHWHYSYLNDIDGILNITTSKTDGGGIDSTPAALRSISLDGDKIAESHLIYKTFLPSEQPIEGAEWSTALGGHGEFAEPIYQDGRVYVGTVDDGYPKKCGIYSLDAETGEIKWKVDTKNSVRNSMAIDGDRIYAQDIEGRVYCIDKTNGTPVWTKETGILAAANTGLNVLVDDGKVYCGGPQTTFCLTAADGSVVWKKDNSRANCSPSRMIIDGNKLIVGSHWDEIIAYDKTNGKRIWDNDKEGLRYRTTTPAVSGDKLYVAATTKVFELDKNNGKILRSRDLGINLDTATSPYICDGIAYFSTAVEGVIAVQLDTFEIKYRLKTGKSLAYTSPYTNGDCATVESSIVPIGDNLVFGASDGYIYLTDKSLNVIGKFNTKSPILSSVAVDGDCVIALDFSGNVTRVNRSQFAK